MNNRERVEGKVTCQDNVSQDDMISSQNTHGNQDQNECIWQKGVVAEASDSLIPYPSEMARNGKVYNKGPTVKLAD